MGFFTSLPPTVTSCLTSLTTAFSALLGAPALHPAIATTRARAARPWGNFIIILLVPNYLNRYMIPGESWGGAKSTHIHTIGGQCTTRGYASLKYFPRDVTVPKLRKLRHKLEY